MIPRATIAYNVHKAAAVTGKRCFFELGSIFSTPTGPGGRVGALGQHGDRGLLPVVWGNAATGRAVSDLRPSRRPLPGAPQLTA
jgi:hypothetical protein